MSSHHNRYSLGPLQIAQEFLVFISQIPSTALEAHGPATEFKVFEIVSAVADSLSNPFALISCSAISQTRGCPDAVVKDTRHDEGREQQLVTPPG